MEITVRQLKNACLVTVSGRLHDLTAPQLDQALQSLQEQGLYRIILDLGGLEELYTAGFLSLGMTQRTCRAHGGELLLVRVPEHIQRILEVTGLASYIPVVDPASLPELDE